MAVRDNRGMQLRAWWATLAAISLLGAGVAYGVTWYQQGELERDATRDARKVTIDTLQPLLVPGDLEGPVRGARYETLAAAVREDVLVGPINGVRIWDADGTVLFADDPSLVGDREPQLRDEIHTVVAGTSEGVVTGERFRVFTLLHVGDAEGVAAELDRSHAAIVAEARKPWYAWVSRGITAAAVFGGLYIATAIVFGLLALFERRAARRPAVPRPAKQKREKRPADDPDLPPYMRPGFQEEALAKRRVEEELEEVRRERDSLRSRVRHLESELETVRGRVAGPVDPAAEGAVPLGRR